MVEVLEEMSMIFLKREDWEKAGFLFSEGVWR